MDKLTEPVQSQKIVDKMQQIDQEEEVKVINGATPAVNTDVVADIESEDIKVADGVCGQVDRGASDCDRDD